MRKDIPISKDGFGCDRKQFEGILRERPEIGMALMRTLCQRLKEASLQKTN